MGTWGVGVFSSDLAEDVREDYRALIVKGLDGPDATDELLRRWGRLADDDEDGTIIWLALAATQSSLGRLEHRVRDRAVAIIDRGADLERWQEDSPELVGRRRAILVDLRARLTGPQPAPKSIRGRREKKATFGAGDIVAYALDDGRSLLLRVVGVLSDRDPFGPIVELVDWLGTDIPDETEIRAMPARDLEAYEEPRYRSATGSYFAPAIIGPSVRGRLSVVGHFDPPPPPVKHDRRFGLIPRTEVGWELASIGYLRWDTVPLYALYLFGEGPDPDA